MQLNFKLEPICTENGDGLKLWGYEVLLRTPIPNALLFAVENPPLDMFLFSNAVTFILQNREENLSYTVNLQFSTLKEYKVEIKELMSHVEGIYIELSEKGTMSMTSVRSAMDGLDQLNVFLDDFGQEESNIYRLLLYSPKGIKLEVDLLKQLHGKQHSWIKNLVKVLKSNGLIVIGERVETEEDYWFAKDIGIEFFQGWWIEQRLSI